MGKLVELAEDIEAGMKGPEVVMLAYFEGYYATVQTSAAVFEDVPRWAGLGEVLLRALKQEVQDGQD